MMLPLPCDHGAAVPLGSRWPLQSTHTHRSDSGRHWSFLDQLPLVLIRLHPSLGHCMSHKFDLCQPNLHLLSQPHSFARFNFCNTICVCCKCSARVSSCVRTCLAPLHSLWKQTQPGSALTSRTGVSYTWPALFSTHCGNKHSLAQPSLATLV